MHASTPSGGAGSYGDIWPPTKRSVHGEVPAEERKVSTMKRKEPEEDSRGLAISLRLLPLTRIFTQSWTLYGRVSAQTHHEEASEIRLYFPPRKEEATASEHPQKNHGRKTQGKRRETITKILLPVYAQRANLPLSRTEANPRRLTPCLWSLSLHTPDSSHTNTSLSRRSPSLSLYLPSYVCICEQTELSISMYALRDAQYLQLLLVRRVVRETCHVEVSSSRDRAQEEESQRLACTQGSPEARESNAATCTGRPSPRRLKARIPQQAERRKCAVQEW